MKMVMPVAASAILLSGCALTTDTKLYQTAVPAKETVPADQTLKQQTYQALETAVGRRTNYVKQYKRLHEEQKWRDAAILAASVGLSATTVFRGYANSLKYAGFSVGLAGLYDKALPLSARITSAKITVGAYNTLMTAGKRALNSPLDADKKAFDEGDLALSKAIDAAKQAIKDAPKGMPSCSSPTSPKSTPNRSAETLAKAYADCWKAAFDQSQKSLGDTADLQASIDAANTTLTKAKIASADLNNLPVTVDATIQAIEGNGQDGASLQFDQKAATTPITTNSKSLASGAPTTPANERNLTATIVIPIPGQPPPKPPLEAEKDKLDAATAQVQAILDRVDYSAISAQIRAAAPKAASTPSTDKTASGSTPSSDKAG